jgi:UDP-N-acetylglucosamine 2-epimerase (non-hydrolysing)
MRTILIFAGTRPEIIKMAPVVRELRARQHSQTKSAWQAHFCFSGQHDELALPFLKYFETEPDSQLNVMDSGQSLGQLRSRAASQLDAFFEKQSGACAALVQGDTTTAFVAALSAFDHKIPVGHVEAGLRTSDITEPFPEELNRRLITRVAKWHYAPTEKARTALLDERVAPESVVVTGNTGIDSFLWASGRSHKPALKDLAVLEGKRLVLVTAHRRENIGTPLERITAALTELTREFRDVTFVLPVHKNPKIAETIRGKLAGIPNMLLTEPLEYPDLVWTMKNAELIMTDSGGIQEEAPSLKKAVLVLRNETERREAIEYGTSFLVESDPSLIVTMAREFLTGKRKLDLKGAANPFGDGYAGRRIVDHLLSQILF